MGARAWVALTPLSPADLQRVEAGPRATDWHPAYPAGTDVALARLAALRLAATPDSRTGLFAVRADGVVVGTLALTPRGPGEGWELGYHVVPAARGRGVATAAVRQVPGAYRPLVAETERSNAASAAVLRAAGLTPRQPSADVGDPVVLQWLLPETGFLLDAGE